MDKAPIFKSLNTDGICPNLCKDVVIEDRYISVGDDAIAIKSKWDRNLTFDNVQVVIVIKIDYNEHPGEGYDPKVVPIIKDISFDEIYG
ncbi:hypothetical protein NC651_033787 [Populus alba x Populus x berolinensis]|nr:hypothetical protein NC651_033787 [Populus alba x Populus x berolinensis]